MKELETLRTYTQKVFDNEDGTKTYRCHVAHKHYKDGNEFKDIDCTLTFNNSSRVWEHNKASYYPKFPEYSDGEFDFYDVYEGANFHIKTKPVCNHVLGVSTNGAEDGNFVLYQNAFAVGQHLKAYAYHHGIKKVIIIDSKPSGTSDLEFKFEVTNIQELINAWKDQNGNQISIGQLHDDYDFKSKTIMINTAYMRDARIWDSEGKNESVPIVIRKLGTKIYIVKIVTRDFMNSAVFPIYTDHPTSYAPTAGDGYVMANSSGIGREWDGTHDASTGNTASYTATTGYSRIGFDDQITKPVIYRAFIPIDSSGIDDGATISSASLYLYIAAVLDNENDGTDWITIVQTDQPSTTELTTSDYNNCGATDNPTEGIDSGNRKDCSSISTGYLEFPLNATGIGWISKTGISMFGSREGHDVTDEAPTGTGWNVYTGIQFSTSEDTSGTKDPYLDVTVAEATTTKHFRTLLGVGV